MARFLSVFSPRHFETNGDAATHRDSVTLDLRLQFTDSLDANAAARSAVPFDYANGNLEAWIWWYSPSTTSGNVVWQVSIERTEVGVTDMTANSFAAYQTVTSSPAGTIKLPVLSKIAFTRVQADSISVQESYRFRVRRDGGAGSDTMVGDALLFQAALVEL